MTTSSEPDPSRGHLDLTPRPASASRMSLAIITHPGQANAFGTLHGGVILRMADECGGIVALRHSGGMRVTTASIDSLVFLSPVHPGERVEITAEVSFTGRSTIECHIVVHAEPLERAEKRKVGEGYGLYVTLDEHGHPTPVPPLQIETEAERARHDAALVRQSHRLARRDEARSGE